MAVRQHEKVEASPQEPVADAFRETSLHARDVKSSSSSAEIQVYSVCLSVMHSELCISTHQDDSACFTMGCCEDCRLNILCMVLRLGRLGPDLTLRLH